jgi:hypothetical protein
MPRLWQVVENHPARYHHDVVRPGQGATHAYRLAALLRFAAIQYVVLVAGAMLAYPGGTWGDRSTTGYDVARNFLSDLGAIHAFDGAANYVSACLFATALVTLGTTISAFAWTWRDFAFSRRRARALGQLSAVLGSTCGIAFIGIALAPIDVALRLHNGFVISAFGLLTGYVASLTYVLWRNGARVAWHLRYVVVVLAYFALVSYSLGVGPPGGIVMMIVAQKVIVAVSMVFVIYLTTTIRRGLATS